MPDTLLCTARAGNDKKDYEMVWPENVVIFPNFCNTPPVKQIAHVYHKIKKGKLIFYWFKAFFYKKFARLNKKTYFCKNKNKYNNKLVMTSIR